MDIFVDEVTDRGTKEEILSLEHEVFRDEMGVRLAPSDPIGERLQLVARTRPDHTIVGSVTVVDTTHRQDLHRLYDIDNGPYKTSARYTRLAVRQPFRGLHIPLFLILECNRRLLARYRYDYTWLLFDAKRAESAALSTLFNFATESKIFQSEYGLCRVLGRNEQSASAQAGNLRAAEFLLTRTGTHFHPTPLSSPNEALESKHQDDQLAPIPSTNPGPFDFAIASR